MGLISVVVPVYHNAETLPELLQRLQSVASEVPEAAFEFVFVDDGSGDNSFAVLLALSQRDDRVRVLKLSRNFGSSAAILAGLTNCSGDCAAVISADLQDPPELIPKLVETWREDVQVVMAARQGRDDPVMSRLFSAVFNRLFQRLVFADFPAGGFDFMLIDRRVITLLGTMQEKNSNIFGQVLWVGFNRRVIYYDRGVRQEGSSQWTMSKKIKYFIDSFAAFSYVPLRFFSLLGALLATLGFIYALIIVILRIAADFPVEGWASLTVIVLVVSGVQLLTMGVLGEYLWRTLDETRHRPPFIVDKMVNIGADRGDRSPGNIVDESVDG